MNKMSIKQSLKNNAVWIVFNLVWFIMLAHILYYGLKPYRHYRFEELISADPHAVLMTMILLSLYFIAGNIMKYTGFWPRRRYLSYLILSTVLMFQSFVAFIGAMHSPPYWAAFIINSMFLLLLHFVFYPIYAISRKYMKPQKN